MDEIEVAASTNNSPRLLTTMQVQVPHMAEYQVIPQKSPLINNLTGTGLIPPIPNVTLNPHQNNYEINFKAVRGKPMDEALPQSYVNRSLIPKYLIDEAYEKQESGMVYRCLLGDNCNKVFKSTTGRLITNYQLRLHINNYHSKWLLHKRSLPSFVPEVPGSSSNSNSRRQSSPDSGSGREIYRTLNQQQQINQINRQQAIQQNNLVTSEIAQQAQNLLRTNQFLAQTADQQTSQAALFQIQNQINSIHNDLNGLQNFQVQDNLSIQKSGHLQKIEKLCDLLKEILLGIVVDPSLISSISSGEILEKSRKSSESNSHSDDSVVSTEYIEILIKKNQNLSNSTNNPFKNNLEALKNLKINCWNNEQVLYWLQLIDIESDNTKFLEILENFKREGILGFHLEALGKSDLVRLGIDKIGLQLSFEYHLRNLKILQK